MEHSKSRVRALVGPSVVAACLVAACAPASVGAAQNPATSPDPAPLWQAYPLDDSGSGATTSQGATPTATTTAQAPSDQAKPSQTPATTRDEAGQGPPWLLIVLAGAGGVLFVMLLLRLQSRAEARREDEPLAPPADEWPWLTSTPATANSDKPRPGAAVKAAKTGPDFEVVDLISVPVRRFERGADVPHRGRFERAPEPEPTPQVRAAAARRGPICQVRWSPRATRFYAVTTDQDGVEHPLARSPRVDWQEQAPPPEDSREAQSALRLLAKELREEGWRPMRAKGYDFEAQQWYARRFRFPVSEGGEGDGQRAPWLRTDAEAPERRRA